MKTVLALFAASAALGQVIVNDNDTFTCPIPDAAYCMGDSLKTDIIVRCDNMGTGFPGRCSDNLSGEPPLGDSPALCWQTDETTGDAACAKNCIVYGGSGNGPNATFTLPTSLCTQTFMPTFTMTDASPMRLITATVYSTSVYTVTSCAPDVTNCPAHLGSVTTDFVSVGTTVHSVVGGDTSIAVSTTHPVVGGDTYTGVSTTHSVSTGPSTTHTASTGVSTVPPTVGGATSIGVSTLPPTVGGDTSISVSTMPPIVGGDTSIGVSTMPPIVGGDTSTSVSTLPPVVGGDSSTAVSTVPPIVGGDTSIGLSTVRQSTGNGTLMTPPGGPTPVPPTSTPGGGVATATAGAAKSRSAAAITAVMALAGVALVVVLLL